MNTSEALKELRAELGETQQQFSNRMGMTVTTIARYETSRPPRGEMLVTFANLAERHGRHDLATVFNNAIIRDLGKLAVGIHTRVRSQLQNATQNLNGIHTEALSAEDSSRLQAAMKSVTAAFDILNELDPYGVRPDLESGVLVEENQSS